MKCCTSCKAALLGGAFGILMLAGSLRAQVNPDWESPQDLVNFTNTTATGWTMFASGEPLGAGDRAAFYNNTPGGRWSYWLRTFEDNGNATQTVAGVTPGLPYTFRSQMLFELGSGATQGPGFGYDAITAINNPTTGNTINSYLQIQFEGVANNPIGAPFQTNIGPTVLLNRIWAPYSVSGLAPPGAAKALLTIGWTGGGGDGGTGSQSAFADDVTFGVPEPTSFALISLGGATLLRRRRAVPTA